MIFNRLTVCKKFSRHRWCFTSLTSRLRSPLDLGIKTWIHKKLVLVCSREENTKNIKKKVDHNKVKVTQRDAKNKTLPFYLIFLNLYLLFFWDKASHFSFLFQVLRLLLSPWHFFSWSWRIWLQLCLNLENLSLCSRSHYLLRSSQLPFIVF